MRPLGDPPSVPTSTSSSPLNSRDSIYLAGDQQRHSNGTGSITTAAPSPNGTINTRSSSSNNNGTNGSSSLVLARRNVSSLTAVQTAAAAGASTLQSRDQLADVVLADLRVREFVCVCVCFGSLCCGC